MEGVCGELRGVARGGQQSAELGLNVGRRQPGGGQEGGSLDQLDDRAPGGARRGAAAGVETGLNHTLALSADGDPNEVATGRAARRAGVPPVRQRPAAARGVEMVLEAHPASLTDAECQAARR